MKCTDARPLLDLVIDGVLEAKDCVLVLDHLKTCTPCQSEWVDLELLRSRFGNAREKPVMPNYLMEKISISLKEEERSERQDLLRKYVKPIPILSLAAAFVAIVFLSLPAPRLIAVKTTYAAKHTASVETLVESLESNGTLEPVAGRSELAKKLGYDLKYLVLNSWQMKQSGIYNSPVGAAIARFDFIKKDEPALRLTCYQAPQGVIVTSAIDAKTVGGKRVTFGNHGRYHYALWCQDGRDYLFVTAASEQTLEKIVQEV
jgi:hypothetical protein